MKRSIEPVRPERLAYRALVQALRDGSVDLATAALRLYRSARARGESRRQAVNSPARRRDRLVAVRDRLRAAPPSRGASCAILPFRRS